MFLIFLKFSNISHYTVNQKTGNYEKSGYTIQLMYNRYTNAPTHPTKPVSAISHLIKEMGKLICGWSVFNR